jgi:hypothetical protein
MENQITLVQLPIINHQLSIVGEMVEKRLKDLNIDGQVVTEETIKTIKELRATLNKEFEEYEKQRKEVKKAVNTPYNALEIAYKEQITGKYEPAIQSLGLKITEFETKLKEEKKAEVVKYFNELCSTEKIDFITFDKVGIEITLSASMKSYKDKCNEFLFKIADDLALIASEQYEAEILTEYKKSLNASKSIIDVKNRKEAEKKERDRIKFQETQRREIMLNKLGFHLDDQTKTYNWVNDSSLLITFQDVSDLSKDGFEKKIFEFEFKTNPKAETLEAPKVEPIKVAPKILTAQFEVQGTYEQLKSLNEYIKEIGLTYKNL